MEKEEVERYLDQANASSLVHKAYWEEPLIKLMTDILLGKSNDYLNLYILEEDGDTYLYDANNVYMILDDYYALSEERLMKAAEEVGLEFDSYRFFFPLSPTSLEEGLKRFKRLVDILTRNER